MNVYGHVLAEFVHRHRPATWAVISDREEHFTRLGEEIAERIGIVRRQIGGVQARAVDPDELARQAAHTLAQAEEAVLYEWLCSADETEPWEEQCGRHLAGLLDAVRKRELDLLEADLLASRRRPSSGPRSTSPEGGGR